MRWPGADWSGPVPNATPGGQRSIKGLVLHRMQGTLSGTDSWFHNPDANASSHFGVDHQTGQALQWVDTEDMAWAQRDGNPDWLSVEISGYVGDQVSDAAVATLAGMWAWVVGMWNVPNQPTDSAGTKGLGWHGMDPDWGHQDCPGTIVKNLRPRICGGTDEDDVKPTDVVGKDSDGTDLTMGEMSARVNWLYQQFLEAGSLNQQLDRIEQAIKAIPK